MWNLLEMQRNSLLMFTSCGWFFNDVSGLETTQILSYASRAIELAKKYTRTSIEKQFISNLLSAESNIRAKRNGASIYKKEVMPLRPKKKKH